MSQQPEQLQHQRVEEVKDPHANTFTLVAGAIMVAEIAFGLLNSMNIIHM